MSSSSVVVLSEEDADDAGGWWRGLLVRLRLTAAERGGCWCLSSSPAECSVEDVGMTTSGGGLAISTASGVCMAGSRLSLWKEGRVACSILWVGCS